jgi:hypothetical protein
MSIKEGEADGRIGKNSPFGRHFTISVIIIIAIFFLVRLILIILPPVGQTVGVTCAINLSGLGKAINVYGSDYDGKYPKADD